MHRMDVEGMLQILQQIKRTDSKQRKYAQKDCHGLVTSKIIIYASTISQYLHTRITLNKRQGNDQQ